MTRRESHTCFSKHDRIGEKWTRDSERTLLPSPKRGAFVCEDAGRSNRFSVKQLITQYCPLEDSLRSLCEFLLLEVDRERCSFNNLEKFSIT